jgi:CheY-like chemotaxis protein
VTRRVLLVDDNVDTCSLYELALTQDGHEVDMVYSGVDGLERLLSTGYDVALVDIGLPGIDGYELARRVKEALRERTPRLVALTGHGRDVDREASSRAGFDVHLVKPIDIQQLRGLVSG